jgi:hypothetical protein
LLAEFRVEVEGGQHIHSELVPVEEAKDKYSDALASGHSSYLLAYKGGGQVFSVSVGLLPPRKEVTVWLRYISQLTVNQGTVRGGKPPNPRDAANLTHSDLCCSSP